MCRRRSLHSKHCCNSWKNHIISFYELNEVKTFIILTSYKWCFSFLLEIQEWDEWNEIGLWRQKMYFTMRDNILMEELNNTCAVTLLFPSLYSVIEDKMFFLQTRTILFSIARFTPWKIWSHWKESLYKKNDAEFVTNSLRYD